MHHIKANSNILISKNQTTEPTLQAVCSLYMLLEGEVCKMLSSSQGKKNVIQTFLWWAQLYAVLNAPLLNIAVLHN